MFTLVNIGNFKYMNLSAQIKNKKGFTLIELLVVIGILAVLLAITLIAINPARQFAQANDTKRRGDVGAILNAVTQYMADYAGAFPVAIPATDTDIVSGGGLGDICTAVVPVYIAAMPFDPKTAGAHYTSCGDYTTAYTIKREATSNRITVTAPDTELASPDIFVTR